MKALLRTLALTVLLACGSENAAPMEPPPATCLEPCGDHAVCDVNPGGAACTCVAGYAGDPCAWVGAVEDPEFTDSDTWQASKGAAISPFEQGMGPGLALFEGSAACNGAVVEQTIELPPYLSAEPLAVEIVYRSVAYGVEVHFGQAAQRLPSVGLFWSTRRFCLGEAAYGRTVRIRVGPAGQSLSCLADEPPADGVDSPVLFELDRFEIVSAEPGECPEPGSVANGTAEPDGGGWEFELPFGDEGPASAALEPGVGRDESGGARMFKPAGSSVLPIMGTKMSVPESMPSPAVRFWWRGNPRWKFQAYLNDIRDGGIDRLGSLFGDGDPAIYTYCLPPWSHGTVVPLWFFPIGGVFVDEAELVVDDVEVFSDPRCGSASDLPDPGFDAAPNQWGGARDGAVAGPSIHLIDDPTRARPPGRGALEITYRDTQDFMTVYTWVYVPRSTPGRGPAFVLYSDVPEDLATTAMLEIGINDPAPRELPRGGGWRRTETCLPPAWAERWFRLRILLARVEGERVQFDPPQQLLLDDFSVTTSAACPTD